MVCSVAGREGRRGTTRRVARASSWLDRLSVTSLLVIDDIIFYTLKHSHKNNPKSIPEQHKPRAIHHSEPMESHNLPITQKSSSSPPSDCIGNKRPYNTGILLTTSRTADRMECSANELSAKSRLPIRVRERTPQWVEDIDHGTCVVGIGRRMACARRHHRQSRCVDMEILYKPP